MPVPEPIGRVHYNRPRAVMVREFEDTRQVHSAVYGPINVYVDSKTDAQKLIDGWKELISAVHLKVEEILGRATPEE